MGIETAAVMGGAINSSLRKETLSDWWPRIAWGLIALSIIARFLWLETSPPGFFIDEAAVAIHSLCLAESGTSAQGNPFPLFFPIFLDGFEGAPYVYFSALWSKLFGSSVYSLRAVSAFLVCLTFLAIFQIALHFTDRFTAILALLSAAVMPWSFNLSRVAWDPPSLPCLVALAVWSGLSGKKTWTALLTAFLFSCAAYAYSPGRLVIAVLVPFILFLRYREKSFNLSYAAILCFSCFLFLLPIIQAILFGGMNARFQMLSILTPHQLELAFGSTSPWLYPALFVRNILYHFDPIFLWGHGDSNLRHSTQVLGQLSWLDALAVVGGIVFFFRKFSGRISPLVLLSVVGVLVGIAPAALTWESIPHALRAGAAWPFFAILSGVGLRFLGEQSRFALPGILGVAGISLGHLLHAYGWSDYPRRSTVWFDVGIKQSAERVQSKEGWESFFASQKDYQPLSLRYYLMHYGKMSCEESRSFELKHPLYRPTP